MARVSRDQSGAISRLRGLSGVEVAESSDGFWLKGQTEEGKLPQELVGVFSVESEVYRLLDDGRLAELESRVPILRLPQLEWESLSAVSQPVLEKLALPGTIPQTTPLSLIPASAQTVEPNVLRVSLDVLLDWVVQSPEIRLEPLRFACGYDGSVVVRGTPIPSLPGARLFEDNGVAVPLGRAWDPPVPATVLAQTMKLAPGDLGILREEDWERIEASNFVSLTRAAVRLTARNREPVQRS